MLDRKQEGGVDTAKTIEETEEYKDEYVTKCTDCGCSSSLGAGALFRNKSGMSENAVKDRGGKFEVMTFGKFFIFMTVFVSGLSGFF